jgi:hypothetical protein
VPKTVNLFRTYLVDSKPEEVLLANYLKAEGVGKDKVIDALNAFYRSLALSSCRDASVAEIELSALDAIAKLQNQIAYIINYHRLNDRIDLSIASLNPWHYHLPPERVRLTEASDDAIEPLDRDAVAPADTYDLSIFDQ